MYICIYSYSYSYSLLISKIAEKMQRASRADCITALLRLYLSEAH